MPPKCHGTHILRSSNASTFYVVCTKCGNRDQVPGGWGKLEKPCPYILTTSANKETFLAYMRELVRPYIGDEADSYGEAEFVSDLSEDGWPDCCKWLEIFNRIYNKADKELTPKERQQLAVYYFTEDGDDVPQEYRL